MKLPVLLLLILMAADIAAAHPARIVLLRHAEKPPERYDVHLTERGEARARALASFLTTNRFCIEDGLPVALFAPEFTLRGHGRRPYETLQPLAQLLKLPIQTPCGAKEYASLAEHVLKDPAYNGKSVVICWVHDCLPALAKKLGVKPEPEPWEGDVYDRVWVVTFHKHRAILNTVAQQLLPGDAGKF